MRNLAMKTKGRFYIVTNPKALPRIYQKEARSISRPLIFEQGTPWLPKLNYPLTEPVMRLTDAIPPITGLVLTSPKENELVEIPIVSPLPTGQLNPVLAHWSYGLGRSVAFTSDAGRRWAKTWPDWQSYAAFWSQVIRWSMRPADRGNLTLNVRREQGRIKVVVDALDKNNQFLNFLQIRGNTVNPDLKSGPIELVQTAPGRYEGAIENAESSGNYFISLGYKGADNVQGVISSGVSVPYSDEYRELRSNPTTLETLASVTDGKVASWKQTPDGRIDLDRTIGASDHFRRDAGLINPRSFAPLWPTLLWLAACLFLGDVAVRRIAIDWGAIALAIAKEWQKIRGREVAASSDYMDKLRSRKAEVDEQLDRSKSAARVDSVPVFMQAQAPPSGPIGEPLLDGGEPVTGPAVRPAETTARPGMAVGPAAPEKQSYTNRLLKAKQRVWEEREKEKEIDSPRKERTE
jgi:hypothetical protein